MRHVFLIFFLPCFAATAAKADFIDEFDSENGGVGVLDYTMFNNFNVTQGSVDLIGNDLFVIYPGNGLYVDLNGSSGQSGKMESMQDIAPGAYILRFLIGNNPDVGQVNSMTVSLGTYSETFLRDGNMDLELISRAVFVDSQSKLRFETPFSDNDNGGVIIDAISVTPVPEPSPVLLLTFGLMNLALNRRSRRHDSFNIK